MSSKPPKKHIRVIVLYRGRTRRPDITAWVDPSITAIQRFYDGWPVDILPTPDAATALRQMNRWGGVDVLVADVIYPKISGLDDVIAKARELDCPRVVAVDTTPYSTSQSYHLPYVSISRTNPIEQLLAIIAEHPCINGQCLTLTPLTR